jgi:predicted kinase
MVKKLIMCQGLPGSGKSYWAAQQDNVLVVNKDDIRKVLETTGWKWSHENEKDVIAKRDDLITEGLKTGLSVISSDTNFGRKHEARLEQLARENGAEFEIKSFLDVPIETCIQRCSERKDEVDWTKVIRGMAAANSLTLATPSPSGAESEAVIKPYVPDPSKPSAIICDLDGTLCLHDGRSPYDVSKCLSDKPNPPIVEIVNKYYHAGTDIIFCSGREEKFRELSMRWLNDHCELGYNLFMRPTGDFRKDWIIKAELFDAHIRDSYNVRFVLDDRDQVVKMWRKMGLTCLQVAEGAF